MQRLNQPVGPLNEPLYAIFARVATLQVETNRDYPWIDLPNPSRLDATTFTEIQQQLADFADRQQQLVPFTQASQPSDSPAPTEHRLDDKAASIAVWADFKPRHWQPGMETPLAHNFTAIQQAAQTLQTALATAEATMPCRIATDLAHLQALGHIAPEALLTPLLTRSAAESWRLLLATPQLARLQHWQHSYRQQQHQYAQARQVLGRVFEISQTHATSAATASQPQTAPLNASAAHADSDASNLAAETPLNLDQFSQQLAMLAESSLNLNLTTQSLAELASQAQQFAHCTTPLRALLQDDTLGEEFMLFWQGYTLLAQIPTPDLQHWLPVLTADLAQGASPPTLASVYADLIAAQHTFTALHEQATALQQFFDFTALPSAAELSALLTGFTQHYEHWYAYLTPAYHQQRFRLKQFLRWDSLVKQPDMLQRLQALQRFQTEYAAAQQAYRAKFGTLYTDGLTMDWAALIAQVNWLQRFSEWCGGEAIVVNLLHRPPSLAAYLTTTLQTAYGHWWGLAQYLSHAWPAAGVAQTEADFTTVRTVLDTLLTEYITLQDILDQLPTVAALWQPPIAQLQQACADMQAFSAFQAAFVQEFYGDATEAQDYADLDTVFQQVAWLTELHAQHPLAVAYLKCLCQHEFPTNVQFFAQVLTVIRQFNSTWQQQCTQLSALTHCDVQVWLCGGDLAQCTLSDLQNRVQQGLATLEWLSLYQQTQQLQHRLSQQGLSPLLSAIRTHALTAQQAAQHYQYAVYHSLARHAIAQNPELAVFTRNIHAETQAQFAALTETVLHNNRQHIAYQLAQHPLPAGQTSGLVSELTEGALLQHEIRKKMRHLPLRQLLQRAGHALQALKPCFMMSPLSVAHYLAADGLVFDVLIMDEASQVRPEEALGAIARCRQWVIVGDSKQLPPTQFFEKSPAAMETTAAAPAIAIEVHESILDIGLTQSQRHQLRWHYRAQHDSLIAFSNQHFYANELLVFPSPHLQGAQLGVTHHYLEAATYQNGINPLEAEQIVAAIVAHFHSDSTASLGVATFNREQQELIADVLDKHCQTDAELERKIRATEPLSEPFFIKNLENVQGDERDVMLISSVYGKDKTTHRVYQRFGPIATEDGWRRLNVIFTRARQQLSLFTSLRASDIQVTAHSKRGLRAWRDYLAYSEQLATGARPVAKGYQPSALAAIVADLLQAQGYVIVMPVGSAGCFVDIGVKHPEQPHRFLAGIICDGLHYYAQASATDRDYLQQMILRHKGWQLFTVWSVDWFKNRHLVTQQLLNFLAELRSQYPRQV